MRLLPLLLLAACTQTANSLAVDATVPSSACVLTGELHGAESVVLSAADGRRFRVNATGGRFLVSVPAGVYDLGDLTLCAGPGDVLYIGSISVSGGVVVVRDGWEDFRAEQPRVASTGLVGAARPRLLRVERSLSPGGYVDLGKNASFFAGESRDRPHNSTRLSRTGSRYGWGRLGRGLGFRGR